MTSFDATEPITAAHAQVTADEVEVDTSMLAAVHAALDPDRRMWKHDILSAIILTVLGMYGAQPLRRLHASVQRTWAAGSVGVEDIEHALALAGKAGLVDQNTSMLSNEVEYRLTAAAQEEVRQDRAWAATVVADFADEMIVRLDAIAESPVREDRRDKLATSLISAIAHAARGTYEVAEGALSLGGVRPRELDVKTLISQIHETVAPHWVADALADVAVAVLDEDDDFGNDLLRLLVVGNMLQGLVSGRDLVDADLEGVRILLDTNVLQALYLEEGGEVLRRTLQRSIEAGVSVEVADHILDEWDRLWRWADDELGDSSRGGVDIGPGMIFVKNPCVQAWIRETDDTERDESAESWTAFSARLRDPRPDLNSLGVRIRPHGNVGEYKRLESHVAGELREMRDHFGRPVRNKLAAEADGCSAAMVARWRDAAPADPPRAWLITKGRRTLEVYQELRQEDPHPVAMTPTAWALYLSCLLHDDELDVNQLVEQLSKQVVRDAYLSVATQFSLRDVEQMGELLAESGNTTISREDLHRTVQLQIEGLNGRQINADDLWLESQRKRSARRDGRAQRMIDTANRREAEAEAKAIEAEARGRRETEDQYAPRLNEAEDRANKADDRTKDVAKFYRRLIATSLFGLLVLAYLIVGFAQEFVPAGWAVAGGAVLAFYGLAAFRFVRDRTQGVSELVITVAAAVLLMVAEVAAGSAVSSPDPAPSPSDAAVSEPSS